MRVIILSDYGFVNGGAAQVAIASLNALAEVGVDVTFVSSVGPVDPTVNRTLVNVINFGFHDLMGNPSKLQSAISGMWNSKASVCFEEVLSSFDPRNTIIHLHTWVNSLSSSVVNIAIKKRFKVVCTCHDYFSICPNGGLYNYTEGKNCDLIPMSIACLISNCDSRTYAHKLWRNARQIVQNEFGHIRNGIKYFISVSHYSESLLSPWLPKKSKFFRIGNPINISQKFPAKVDQNDVFTFIGRLSIEKGAVLFASAAKLTGVRSVFVGSGNEKSNIQNVNQLSEFLGWQDRAGVIEAIRNSRAVIFPSLLHESQGLVVKEAAALGVPVIASDGCAARDDIIHGETGLLFKARDSYDLANKIELLNKSPDLAKKLGRNAYERYWASPSTLEKHVTELISCYKHILSEDSENRKRK